MAMGGSSAVAADELSSKVSEIVINESVDTPDDVFTKNWGFPLDDLYKLCSKFYKENEGKVNQLQLAYADNIKLKALQRQALKGKYVEGMSDEPGLLDVVGNDRKMAWQALGSMSKGSAKAEFVRLLDSCCQPLKPFIMAHKKDLEEKRREEEARRAKEAQEAAAAAQAAAQAQQQQQLSPDQQRVAVQHMQIRQALNQQTEQQFLAYAQAQFPGNEAQQRLLIGQLQEQHFQQYMEQYMKQLYLQQQQQQQQVHQQSEVSPGGAQGPPIPPAESGAGAAGGQSAGPVNGLPAGGPNAQGEGSPLDAHPPHLIQDASAWTKREIADFKSSIKKESQLSRHSDSIISVGSGETVTIRVPTHSQGKCLFWEFATDSYDIAFGVYFEWSTPGEGTGVEVHISDSEDDEDEEDTANGSSSATGDPEKGGGARAQRDGPPVDEIIPIYRRDSHQEVYCGSHVYPGKGVYLLKFDNSYSLWRAKTLYYRVYYSS